MEDWNDYQPDPVEYTSGKPTADTYACEDTVDIDWADPKQRAKALTEDSSASKEEIVKVGKKYLPKDLARQMKNGPKTRS